MIFRNHLGTVSEKVLHSLYLRLTYHRLQDVSMSPNPSAENPQKLNAPKFSQLCVATNDVKSCLHP